MLKLIRASCFFLLLFVFSSAFGKTESLKQSDSDRATSASLAADFNVSVEFPNYFLPEPYRGLKPHQIPADVLQASEQALASAMQSVFKRLLVPVTINKETKLIYFFDELNERLQKIDRTAKVFPSGGVIRSAVSYVYKNLYERLQESPDVDPLSVLRELSQQREGIPAYHVRGIGSDFDVLIYQFTKGKEAAIEEVVSSLLSSSEVGSGMKDSKTVVKQAFFTGADAKIYQDQIRRSTLQGGADIDFLAFDIEAGKFILPPQLRGGPSYQNLIKNLVAGYYQYLPPVDTKKIEDPAKQTVRGLRPLLELPFIQLLDESQLRTEMTKIQWVSTELSPKALEQFDKLTRNARFSGANNRFYRGSKKSLEEAVFTFIKKISPHKALIPEFVDRMKLDRPSDIPSEFLIPMEQFVAEHTNKGILYHGTPELRKALAIMRGGLFISGGINNQGLDAMGRGGYSAKERRFSAAYAGKQGLVIALRLKSHMPVRILDWEKAKDSEWVKSVIAENRGRDIFEVLARKHGADLILNQYVLIQNAEAFSMQTDIHGLLVSISDAIDSQLKSPAFELSYELVGTLKEFVSIHRFFTELDQRPLSLPDFTPVIHELSEKLHAGRSYDPLEDYEFLKQLSGINKVPLKISKSQLEAAIAKLTYSTSSDWGLDRGMMYLLLFSELYPDDPSALAKRDQALKIAGILYARTLFVEKEKNHYSSTFKKLVKFCRNKCSWDAAIESFKAEVASLSRMPAEQALQKAFEETLKADLFMAEFFPRDQLVKIYSTMIELVANHLVIYKLTGYKSFSKAHYQRVRNIDTGDVFKKLLKTYSVDLQKFNDAFAVKYLELQHLKDPKIALDHLKEAINGSDPSKVSLADVLNKKTWNEAERKAIADFALRQKHMVFKVLQLAIERRDFDPVFTDLIETQLLNSDVWSPQIWDLLQGWLLRFEARSNQKALHYALRFQKAIERFLTKWLFKHPGLLSFSLKKHPVRTIEFLKFSQMSESQLSKIVDAFDQVVKNPRTLSSNQVIQLKKTVAFIFMNQRSLSTISRSKMHESILPFLDPLEKSLLQKQEASLGSRNFGSHFKCHEAFAVFN